MKVLWFTSVTPPAVLTRLSLPRTVGPASWVDSLREALAGHEDLHLAIAAPCPENPASFAADGVAYYCIPVEEPSSTLDRMILGWRETLTSDDMSRAALEIIEDFDPDVVHVHGTENPFGLLGPQTRVPLVISLQGLLTLYERFYFRGMTSREVAGLALHKSFVLGWGGIHGYWRCVRMAAREREIMRVNSSFIGRTAWDRAILSAVNPHSAYHHCDEILRSPFYESQWHDAAATRWTIYCTSGAMAGKGVECLIEAVALLRRSSFPDVRLRIAGITNEDRSYDFYAHRARKHGIADVIDWIGRLDADGLVAELLHASVFAYPSHIDNSPNALCEALLVGVPTVASYVGGIPSLIDDGRDGLLYPDGDPYALAGRLRRLFEDRPFAAGLGHSARLRALKRHDPDSVVTSLVGIYRSLLS